MSSEDHTKPLYRMVSEKIIDDIRLGKYSEYLPPQDELTRIYEVGRSTIREALRKLDEEGIIRVRHGAATKILGANHALAIQPGLESFVGVTRLLQSSGFDAGTSFVHVRRTHATSFFFSAFNGKPIVVLERVRTADDIPVVFSTDAFVDKGWDLTQLEEELKETSLLRFFDREVAAVSYAETIVRAQLPDPLVTDKLKLSSDEPVLVLDEVSYDAQGNIVNCSTDYYHPRHISFRVLRKSDNPM